MVVLSAFQISFGHHGVLSFWLQVSVTACVQTEELLTKRRDLLEKKIGIELQRAKDASAAKNKRGAPFRRMHTRISLGRKVHCRSQVSKAH